MELAGDACGEKGFVESEPGEHRGRRNRVGDGLRFAAGRDGAVQRDCDDAVGEGHRIGGDKPDLRARLAGGQLIDEFDRAGWRGSGELDGIAWPGARFGDEIDDVVVDNDGGHDDIGPTFATRIGKQSGVDVDMAFDPANPFCEDILGELFDDRQGITRKRGAVVGVVMIDEGESAVGLDAIGKIGIATGDEDEVAVECAVLVD